MKIRLSFCIVSCLALACLSTIGAQAQEILLPPISGEERAAKAVSRADETPATVLSPQEWKQVDASVMRPWIGR
jgi:hypothetical protein